MQLGQENKAGGRGGGAGDETRALVGAASWHLARH